LGSSIKSLHIDTSQAHKKLKLNMKNIFWGVLGFFVIYFSLTNFFWGTSAAVKEAVIAVAEADSLRGEAEARLDSVSIEYDRAVDSLSVLQDSLSSVVAASRIDARRASIRFDESVGALQDSLAVIDLGLAQELGQVIESHDRVVLAMEAEIGAINRDRELLWRRIEVSDSLLAVQAGVNDALRGSVMALEGERDAWRAKAMPPLPKRLMDQTPALLAGALLVSLIR